MPAYFASSAVSARPLSQHTQNQLNILFLIVTSTRYTPHIYLETMMMLEQYLGFDVVVRLERQQRGRPHLHMVVSIDPALFALG
jgi:hypothetical protein